MELRDRGRPTACESQESIVIGQRCFGMEREIWLSGSPIAMIRVLQPLFLTCKLMDNDWDHTGRCLRIDLTSRATRELLWHECQRISGRSTHLTLRLLAGRNAAYFGMFRGPWDRVPFNFVHAHEITTRM